MTSEITLKHLSQISGFSISTISKALNDKLDISRKTKVKIQELAKSFNYVPNNNALALISRKTKIIALIVPKINSLLYSNIISVIQEHAFYQGYRILILQSQDSEEKELECINNLRDGCVDGIIVIKPLREEYETIGKISNMLPTVIHELDTLPKTNIASNYLGIKLLNLMLIKLSEQSDFL